MPVPTPLVIVGAGGHGREMLGVVRSAVEAGTHAFDLLGFLDDSEPDQARLGRLGVRWLGPVAGADRLPAGTGFLIGVGAPAERETIDRALLAEGLVAVTVVHPRAVIGHDVVLGGGTVVCAFASVTTNVRTGRHNHLNVAATVAHDCRLGDYVTVSPGAHVSGNVELEAHVTVGTGACVIQGVRVGRGTMIGAGAAVVRDVPAGRVVTGVPARG